MTPDRLTSIRTLLEDPHVDTSWVLEATQAIRDLLDERDALLAWHRTEAAKAEASAERLEDSDMPPLLSLVDRAAGRVHERAASALERGAPPRDVLAEYREKLAAWHRLQAERHTPHPTPEDLEKLPHWTWLQAKGRVEAHLASADLLEKGGPEGVEP